MDSHGDPPPSQWSPSQWSHIYPGIGTQSERNNQKRRSISAIKRMGEDIKIQAIRQASLYTGYHGQSSNSASA